MEQRTLETLDSGDCRPTPRIQDTTCIDEKVTSSLECRINFSVVDLHYPLGGVLVPARSGHFVVTRDVPTELVLVDEVTEVLEDLARWRIGRRPVALGIESVRVVVAILFSRMKFECLTDRRDGLTQERRMRTPDTDSRTTFPQCLRFSRIYLAQNL